MWPLKICRVFQTTSEDTQRIKILTWFAAVPREQGRSHYKVIQAAPPPLMCRRTCIVAAVVEHLLLGRTDFLAPYPWMRELIAIMFSQQTILALTPKHSMVLQVELAAQKSSSGRVISSIQDPGALSVAWPSEAEKVGDYLYLGSWHEPYLARIPWNATPFSRG